jgi:PII-like signaling protein
MRVLEGEQTLVRIFIGDEDKWHHQPLHRVLLERLRREGFAGATVLHGISGFGAASIIHTSHLVDLSGDLPVIIEVVDDDEHIAKLLPILDEMITKGGLVTMEKVHVVKYEAGDPKSRRSRNP